MSELSFFFFLSSRCSSFLFRDPFLSLTFAQRLCLFLWSGPRKIGKLFPNLSFWWRTFAYRDASSRGYRRFVSASRLARPNERVSITEPTYRSSLGIAKKAPDKETKKECGERFGPKDGVSDNPFLERNGSLTKQRAFCPVSAKTRRGYNNVGLPSRSNFS